MTCGGYNGGMIDITFDMFSDSPPGMDPDSYSPTLQRYHKLLWSKPLPSGKPFALSDSTPGAYLHHQSDVGGFFLSSDAITHSYVGTKAMIPLLKQLPPGTNAILFEDCSTIGAYTLFPANRINGKMTINGARGMSAKIKDRFDLTLECIRRHYTDEDSPLAEVLQRYSAFFDLFETFEGYVDFFLFQDLVADDCGSVKFYLPFDNFERPALPQDADEYIAYRELTLSFVAARNERIKDATT
jgi:hypothetical protein